MKVTIIAEDGPVIYEDATFVEIETPEPVTFDCTYDHSVQIYKVEE